MITLFEQETCLLNDSELVAAQRIADYLSTNAVGKDNVVLNDRLQLLVADIFTNRKAGARVRKIINHIRITGMVERLVANSKGYYISNNPQEIEIYLKSLDDRLRAIYHVRKVLATQYKKHFGKTIQLEMGLEF